MEMSKKEIAISVDWNVWDSTPPCEGLITKIWTTPICLQLIYAIGGGGGGTIFLYVSDARSIRLM